MKKQPQNIRMPWWSALVICVIIGLTLSMMAGWAQRSFSANKKIEPLPANPTSPPPAEPTPPAVNNNITNKVICIDPGHPSEVNSGEEIQNGLKEVTVAWQIAIALKPKLEKLGYTVVLTKTAEKQFVTNKKRAEIANQSNAAALVRLHLDTGNHKGFAVYYPSEPATKNGVTGPSSEIIQKSRTLAQDINEAINAGLNGKLLNNGIKTDKQTYIGERQGALTGSIYAKTPIVLIEMAVLSNKEDALFISNSDNQIKVAELIANGINVFCSK